MATIARRNVIVEFTADTSQLQRGAASAERQIGGLQRVFQNAASTFAGLFAFDIAGRIAGGINEIARSTVSLAVDAEQTQVAFETFLGSAEKATKLIAELNKFSEVTPFEPTQVIKAGQALLAFGVDADKVTESLTSIGDLAAGTGTDFNELAEIFGKAKVQGRLFGEDINQLTGRGIPIIGEFAKQFDVSEDEVKGLVSQGKIGFPQLEKAFEDLTGEGGKFFDLMNKQSQTVGGRISTLKGNFDALLRTIGEGLLPAVGRTVEFFNRLVSTVKEFVEVPVSQKLAEERLELNALVLQITDANTSQERRNELIQQLQAEYPDFLANLDAESVSNREIAIRLEQVNKQLIANIALQIRKEAADKAVRAAGEAQIVTQDAIAEADRAVIDRLEVENRARAENNKLTQRGLQDRIAANKENLERADNFINIARDRFGLELDFVNNTIERRIFNLGLSEIETANLFKRFQAIIKARQAEESASQEALKFQKELTKAQEEFNKEFGVTEELKDKDEKRVSGLSAKEKKRLEKEAADRLKARQKELEMADKLAKDFAARQQKRAEDEIKRMKEIGEAEEKAANETGSRIKTRLEIEAERREVQEDARAREEKAEQDRLDAIDRQNEAVRGLVDASVAATLKIVDSLQDANDKRIDLLDNQIEKQEDTVSRALLLAEEGNTRILELEEERLNELENKREEATRRQQQLAAVEIAIQQAVAVANSVAAVAKAFNLPPPLGIITGVATSIALAAQVAASIVAINNSFSGVGGFAEGTEFFEGQGGPKSDSNIARISRGERIVPTDKNMKYFSTLNEFQKGTPMADMLHNIAQGGPVVSQQAGSGSGGYDMGRLEKEMSGIRKLLSHGDTSITLDKDGFSVHMQKYRAKKMKLRKRIG